MCFQEIVPKLKLLTVYSLIPVESVANFWVEKFGDNISFVIFLSLTLSLKKYVSM